MAGDETRGAETRNRTEAKTHDRNGGEIVDDVFPALHVGHIGALIDFQRLDRTAAAGAVDQTHDRQLQLVGHLLGIDLLGADRGIARAAAHGEIITADDNGTAVDAAAPHDEVAGKKFGHLTGFVVGRLAGDAADLVEGAGIEHLVDALAHREALVVVLALDLLRAAHLVGELLTRPKLVDFLLPAHVRKLPEDR